MFENGNQCIPVLGMNILKEAFPNLTLCTNVEESTNNFILLTHIIQNGLENNLQSWSNLSTKDRSQIDYFLFSDNLLLG